MSRLVDVRRGTYRDSVSLMQVSARLSGRAGVRSALVAMATPLNLTMLGELGFSAPPTTSPQDLLVAIEADDEDSLASAVADLDALLDRGGSEAPRSGSWDVAPTTVEAAARREPAATLALVSTPGRYAAVDAAGALAARLDVMLFSDNVRVEDEVALKRLGAALGLLVMGPDCGTAVVDGVGLGFANVVRPGPVGIVAASGTGAQQVMTLLSASDVGIAACLGVGGRDLTAEVGGLATLVALDRLAADDDVEVVVLLSKPPDEEVANLIAARAADIGKPVVFGYLGTGRPDLTEVAASTCAALGVPWCEPDRWAPDGPARTLPAGPAQLSGSFCGGTLCTEAELVVDAAISGVDAPHPIRCSFTDYGDDTYTAGRPHPMIDPTLRLEGLTRDLALPSCVCLVDVVLGLGAHADPTEGLADAIASSEAPVIVSLVGTRDDPQSLEETVRRLTAAGAVVHTSNAAAAREAARLVVEAVLS